MLPKGIASHDTFARVFRLIDTDAQEQACQQWLASLVGRVQGVVAIDSKSVHGLSARAMEKNAPCYNTILWRHVSSSACFFGPHQTVETRSMMPFGRRSTGMTARQAISPV